MAYIYINSSQLPMGANVQFQLGPVKSYNAVSVPKSYGRVIAHHAGGVTVLVDDKFRVYVKTENVLGIVH